MSTSEPNPIVLSEGAAAKIQELLLEEGSSSLHLRISVSGGGCSGLQYGIAFEEAAATGDLVFETLGVRVLIDPVSLGYLKGAEVDFHESLEGARFVIKNPNAQSTCGCGSSFSTTEPGGPDVDHPDRKSCSSRTAIS